MNALLTPSVRQIAAQVEAILKHDPHARAIGIRAKSSDQWPSRITVQEREFTLAWCPSPIAVRSELVSVEPGSEDAASRPHLGVVILTPLDDQALGADVLARLSRGRVFAVESWEVLRHAFQAREIDSRLAKCPWVAEALLDSMPVGGYPPAPGGFLDADTAWNHALRAVLGLAAESSARPDLTAVLRWTLGPEACRRYESLPEAASKQIGEWLADTLGSCGYLVKRILDSGFGGELMPLAFVMGLIFDRPATAHGAPVPKELLAASVRLERFTGGFPVPASDGLRLYRAASQALEGLDTSLIAPILDCGDRLLETLHLHSCSYLSNDLPAGFNARLTLFADSISEFAASPSTATIPPLVAAGQDVLAHRLAGAQPLRARRVEMAMRLARWLAISEAGDRTAMTHSLEETVREFSEEGAYVDWARLALLGGDELAGLSRAYSALREVARIRREAHNKLFAERLAAWNASGCPPVTGIVPVEEIVSDVVAPLAARAPVLLLVVDGLSYPIYRELLEDAVRHGWTEILPDPQPKAWQGLATIPSVTESSRTSLLVGRLSIGQAAHEKSGFAQHQALVALNASNRAAGRPVVFHKADLTDTDGISLSDTVRNAMQGKERRVVAVVFNGVDDHLSGSDQLQPRWTLDDLRLIKPLLYEARLAGRTVVLTADHGHLIDESTQVPASSPSNGGDATGGDRWRVAGTGPLATGEMYFQGGRVVRSGGNDQVVAAWSEMVRYGTRKNGYHGGVSLQEMVVPLALLTTGAAVPEGYRILPTVGPDWWDVVSPAVESRSQEPSQAPQKTQVRKPKAAAGKDERQATLFSEASAAVSQGQVEVSGNWVEDILGSAIYQSQKQWVARAALKDEEIRALLEALAERGGKLSKQALAGKLGLAPLRVSGFINAARRVLNVDQTPVLTIDETEGSVSLNQELAKKQFNDKAQGAKK